MCLESFFFYTNMGRRTCIIEQYCNVLKNELLSCFALFLFILQSENVSYSQKVAMKNDYVSLMLFQ